MRASNNVFPNMLEGAAPLDAIVKTSFRTFQKKLFGCLCVVMKHPTLAIVMTAFQRDPSFSARVSRGSYAWRTLIDHFDKRGVGRTVG
jgi:hypothetical protein